MQLQTSFQSEDVLQIQQSILSKMKILVLEKDWFATRGILMRESAIHLQSFLSFSLLFSLIFSFQLGYRIAFTSTK